MTVKPGQAREIIDAMVPVNRQPGADSATDIDHAVSSGQFEHHRHDHLCGAQGAMQLVLVECVVVCSHGVVCCRALFDVYNPDRHVIISFQISQIQVNIQD